MMNSKNKHTQAFLVKAIIEIAGKPKNYIEDAMRLVMKNLNEEEGIKVIKSKTHEAKEHSGIFSTFSEVELSIEDNDALLLLCFEYTPSSVEFIEPEELKIDSVELTEMFNDLLARLHQTDARLKDANAANIMLEKNSHSLLKRSLSLILKEGDKPLEDISKSVGILPEQLKPFLDQYVRENIIIKKGDKYGLKNAAV